MGNRSTSSTPQVIGRDILGRVIRDFTKIPWWGLPRESIPWYPRIDYERCIGCGLCFLTCSGRVVYDWDFRRDKPIVARPYNCMIGCDTCAKLCPRDAIIFPSLGELRKWRDKAQAQVKARRRIEELKNRVIREKQS